VAPWYCWYSETRSFTSDSASVNTISSIPSRVPVEEVLTVEQAGELLADTLGHLLMAVELLR
jgi:hypothetical protein